MATYQMSSLDDLRSAVADGPLAWQLGRLVEVAMPQVALLEDPDAPTDRLGTTRLGGCPDLPRGSRWPARGEEALRPAGFLGRLRRNHDDDPEALGFIAQIRLEEVAGLVPGLPASGLVSIFLTTEHLGCDAPDGWAVIYTPDCSDLVRLAMPQELAEEFTTATVALAPQARVSFPSNSSDAFHALELTDEQQHAYDRLPWIEDGDEGGDHRLLGWAHEWQGNLHTTVAEAAAQEWGLPDEPDEWVLLLQVDTCDEPEMFWGDGAGYFMIRREDLAAGRFDQVMHEMHAL